MSQTTAYRIGHFLGRLPAWAKIALVVSAVAWFLWPSETQHSPTESAAGQIATTESKAAREAAERERVKTECQGTLEKRRLEYAAQMKANKPWEASLALRKCADVLQDPDLLQLVKDAEIKSHLADLNDPAKSADSKSLAFRRLVSDYPEVASKHEQLATRQIAAAERREQEQERKRKRSEGVRIGMSREDVLASAWGKPERVNRTTTAYGTREQWVYGGRNYLYFEDGVLTSIQN